MAVTAEDLCRFAHTSRMVQIETDNPRQFKARRKEYAKTLAEYRAWWKGLSAGVRKEIQKELSEQHARGINPVMTADPDATADAIRETAAYLSGEE